MASIPLYQHDEIASRPENANTGLWYDKFCNQWTDDWGPIGDRKKDWIQTVTDGEIGNRDEIEIINKRMKKLIESSSGKVFQFKNESRFVTGLGKNHPVENGFTWHHSLGVPYIPGTSVKGIVRDWARQNGVEKSKIDRLFGPDDNSERSAGSIIFLDALPAKPVSLSADIMTPHYGPYYSDQEIPGDWHDPNPIPFLTVDKDQEFLFGILSRGDVSNEEIDEVGNWLIEALDWSGAGAKTNVGYGRFKHIKIRSPAENWLIEISEEFGIDISKITSNPTKDVISRWSDIKDKDFKTEVAIILKNRIILEDNWDGKRWGQLEKLKKALKQYMGG